MLQNLINPIDADGKQLQKMIKYQGMSNGVPMVFRTGDKVREMNQNVVIWNFFIRMAL